MPTLFSDKGALSDRLREALDRTRASVHGVRDEEAIGRDRDEWVDALVQKARFRAPVVPADGQPEVESLGRSTKDVTGQAGISYSVSEWGNVQRETVNYRATLRFEGDVELLLCAPGRGAAYTPAESISATEGTVAQGFYYVLGSETPDQFRDELQQWVGQVTAGAASVAEEVERFNEELPHAVAKIVDKHVATATAAAAFTAALPFAVSKREDAPPQITSPAIRSIRSEIPRTGALPQDQPTLGRYFDEILGVLRSAIRALERTPGRYHAWDEESLRDALLIPLNAQFQGAGDGEAFNASGKADLLIRAGDQNLFIGECKIWDGPSRFIDAVDQLLSYSTWRDSRLALIVFVKNKEVSQIAAKAQSVIENRREFEHWLVGTHGQKARIRWTDDPARTATLALTICHLHDG